MCLVGRERRGSSEQVDKLFFREARFTDQCPQSSFGQFPVIWNGEAAHLRMTKNDMTASLMIHLIAHFLKSADGVLAGANGQAAHAGISTISSLMGGGV